MSSIYDENAAMQRCIHDTLLEIRDELRDISTVLSNRPIYGVWQTAIDKVWGWRCKVDGDVVSSPFRNLLQAYIETERRLPCVWEVREIGPDGLPVPID